MFGLVLEKLESLRLAASEGFDSNCWGEGGTIFFYEGKQTFFFGGDWGVGLTWMGNLYSVVDD